MRVIIQAEALRRSEKTIHRRFIQELPTIVAVPLVRGNWLGEGDGYADGYPVMDVWYCSQCNHCIDDGTDNPEMLPNYCPNCGAKMKNEEEPQCTTQSK